MTSLIKNLLIVLSLALAGFLVYMIFQNKSNGGLLMQSDSDGLAAAIDTEEIRNALSELGSYEIDGSLFDDPAFDDLRDFRLDLGSEQTGRRNPFAPI